MNTLADSAETTALILHDLRNPNNADDHSSEAKDLDFERLNDVFERLASLGLVAGTQELTDGVTEPRAGVTHTWWSMTAGGRRAQEDWEAGRSR